MDALPVAVFFNLMVGILFLIYWSIVFIIIYHLARFGIGVAPKKFAAVFLLGSVILFCAAIIFYLQVDFAAIIQKIR